jgi:hypothetical protein
MDAKPASPFGAGEAGAQLGERGVLESLKESSFLKKRSKKLLSAVAGWGRGGLYYGKFREE